MSCVSMGRWRALMVFVLWLSPAAVYAESVTLAWDASTGAAGYTVRWGTVQGTYPNSANAGANTTFVISGLTAGATYWTVVQAYNSAGVSEYSTPLQFTVPLTVACTYSISPGSVSVSGTSTTGIINVSTQTGCAWSATSASSFLTFSNGTGRTGSGSVTYAVTANTGSSTRTGTATVAGKSFSLTQAAATACTYSINPGAATVGYGAATGVIDVTTQTGCGWNATSASSFLTFSNGSGRSGSGSVTYSIAANSTTSSRIGTATVAGKAFSVSQAAAPPTCSYSISPGSASVSADATTGTITVTTQSGCAWTASTTSGFLTFDNATGRSGSGVVTYAVTANAGTTLRTASATVAGKSFTLSQAAASQSCTYSISPTNTTVGAAAGGGAFTMSTQPGCPWSATSSSSFLTFPNGSGRTGSGSIDFAVTENTGVLRTGKGTVAGKTITVYQLAASCTFTVDPERTTAPAAAGTVTVNVTTQADCAWSARSLSAYITIANGEGRTGSGTVDLATAANTDTSSRIGIAAIAGATVYVTQDAAGTTPPPPGDTPAAPWSSDFDGDGKNDLLLQDATTGAVEAWFLDNATLKGRQALSDVMDANWALVGRGDFNADGKPDLVWQHKLEGTVSVWYMNGTARIGMASPSISAPGDPQWKIVGVGDFNKDGRPDLTWQHAGDGTLAAWLMNGITVIDTVNFVPSGVSDLLWKVVGVADFNGDGNTDLLWRHMGTGDLTTWLLNGLSRTITAPLNPLAVRDQRWQIGAVTDANGDGKPDIVWEHTDGTIMIWHMNGTSRTTYPIVPTAIPAGWHLVGPK